MEKMENWSETRKKEEEFMTGFKTDVPTNIEVDGKVFCLTGFHRDQFGKEADDDYKTITNFINSNNGTISVHVDKKTDYLIIYKYYDDHSYDVRQGWIGKTQKGWKVQNITSLHFISLLLGKNRNLKKGYGMGVEDRPIKTKEQAIYVNTYYKITGGIPNRSQKNAWGKGGDSIEDSMLSLIRTTKSSKKLKSAELDEYLIENEMPVELVDYLLHKKEKPEYYGEKL